MAPAGELDVKPVIPFGQIAVDHGAESILLGTKLLT
jgi:hypothetical protein